MTALHINDLCEGSFSLISRLLTDSVLCFLSSQRSACLISFYHLAAQQFSGSLRPIYNWCPVCKYGKIITRLDVLCFRSVKVEQKSPKKGKIKIKCLILYCTVPENYSWIQHKLFFFFHNNSISLKLACVIKWNWVAFTLFLDLNRAEWVLSLDAPSVINIQKNLVSAKCFSANPLCNSIILRRQLCCNFKIS